MADYLYKTTLYYETDNVIGINVSQNDTDLADWHNNYEAQAQQVTNIVISQTTFETEMSWTDFKALIDGVNITWADVKYYEDNNRDIIALIKNT